MMDEMEIMKSRMNAQEGCPKNDPYPYAIAADPDSHQSGTACCRRVVVAKRKLPVPTDRTRWSLIATFGFGVLLMAIAGCSTTRLSIAGRSHESHKSGTASVENHSTAAAPACAAPTCVVEQHPVVSPPQMPGQESSVTSAQVPPVPPASSRDHAYEPSADPHGKTGALSGQSVEDCRREAAELKRRMETMEAEVNSCRRSSEVIAQSNSAINRQLEKVARDNELLQQEMLEMQRAAEQQLRADLESLDNISQLLEQQLNDSSQSNGSSDSRSPADGGQPGSDSTAPSRSVQPEGMSPDQQPSQHSTSRQQPAGSFRRSVRAQPASVSRNPGQTRND